MLALAYATDFKINARGKREIERRFTSRREGTNVEYPRKVYRSVKRPVISKPSSFNRRAPRNKSRTCKAKDKINKALLQSVKNYKAAVATRKSLIS